MLSNMSVYMYFLMFAHRYFFEEYSDFDHFSFVGKISASWWSRSENFLNPRVVNLSVCLFNILFGYNFRKNRTMARKFWLVFQLHRFALHMANSYCTTHRSFYTALQKFQYINIFCNFLIFSECQFSKTHSLIFLH